MDMIYTICYGEKYLNITKIFLNSLFTLGNFKGQCLVFCDKEYSQLKINNNIKFIVVDKLVRYEIFKLRITAYKFINFEIFDKVMYFDCDSIVVDDVYNIINEIVEDSLYYVEKDWETYKANNRYNLDYLDRETINENLNRRAINAGHFGFIGKYSINILKLWEDEYNTKEKYEAWYDQASLNKIVLCNIIKNKAFTFNKISFSRKGKKEVLHENTCVYHFIDGDKEERMQKFFPNRFKKIDGCLTDYEHESISKLIVKNIKDKNHEINVLEIGSYKLKTAICISDFMLYNNIKHKIYTFDIYGNNGTMGSNRKYNLDENKITLNMFKNDNIILHTRDSCDIANKDKLKGVVFDFVYIDADHSYAKTIQDITFGNSCSDQNTIFLGDDYHPKFDGVVKAVNQMFKKYFVNGKLWATMEFCKDSLLYKNINGKWVGINNKDFSKYCYFIDKENIFSDGILIGTVFFDSINNIRFSLHTGVTINLKIISENKIITEGGSILFSKE
jgi:hypothetical protein